MFHTYAYGKCRSLFIHAATAVLLLCPLKARAADPSSAAYSRDSSKIFWIIHISDTHIGSSYHYDTDRFEWFFEEAVPVIQPLLIFNTGDLVDGSISGIPASGQTEDEWSLYRSIIDAGNATPDFYYDLPGNHDAYGNEGLTYYLEWSLSGSTYGTLTRSVPVSTSFGDYFFFGASTADTRGKRFVDSPEWYPEELEELETQLAIHDSADLIFVLGHHPPTMPKNGEVAMELIRQHGGFYIHGHRHRYEQYLHDGIVVAQVDALGKSNSENLAVMAVDNNAVTYSATDSKDAWPFLLITAPVSKYLLSGEENPYAYKVCNTGEENPIRALVFDANMVSAVMVETQDGTTSSLVRDPMIPQLWSGTFDASGLGEGEHTLTVTAAGSKVRSRQVTIELADVDCPQPLEPVDPEPEDPDAGVFEDASGISLDASDQPDASHDASTEPDGGVAESSSSAGCNCRVASMTGSTGIPSGPAGVLLLLAVVFVSYRRRR